MGDFKKQILFGSLGLLWAVYFYFDMRYLRFMDTEKRYAHKNDQQCNYMGLPGAPDDLVLYKDRFILSAVNNNIDYFVNGRYEETPNGEFVLVDTQDFSNFKTLKVKNFPPQGVKFHPQGIFLDQKKDYLYVISHSYSSGGERIEVFELNYSSQDEVSMKHKRSLILPAYLMGVSNDLIVLDEGDTIFLTKSSPLTDPKSGRDTSSYANSQRWIKTFLGGSTQVYKCQTQKNSDALKCAVFLSGGDLFSGIEWDQQRSTIYVSDEMKYEVRAVKIDQNTKKIQDSRDYKLKQHPQKIILIGDTLYIGVYVSRTLKEKNLNAIKQQGRDHYTNHPGGGISLNLETGKVNEIVIQNNLYGTSVLLPIKQGSKKRAVIGGWTRDVIGICEF